jgi:hypothetical protein
LRIIPPYRDQRSKPPHLLVDGGAPTGKKNSIDDLKVFYAPPRPSQRGD